MTRIVVSKDKSMTSSRIDLKKFEKETKIVFETVVKPQIEFAKTHSQTQTQTQTQTQKSVNSPI